MEPKYHPKVKRNSELKNHNSVDQTKNKENEVVCKCFKIKKGYLFFHEIF